jgi:thiol:disulfide interchange protein DsbD
MDFSGLSDALGSSPLTAIPLLFVGGLLTSLTPCVYPMIPITVALVGQESLGPQRSKWRPLLLTMSYVTGLATVYALLGVVAGMTGSIFGSISSNPWLYFLQANVLLLAGLFRWSGQPGSARVVTTAARLRWGVSRDWWRRPVAPRSWQLS